MTKKEELQNRMVEILGTEEITDELKAEYESCKAELVKFGGMEKTELQCIEAEMEYREWKENPLWYCVKTLFNMSTGKMESEIVKDENTKQLIAIQGIEKPQDGVYETEAEIIYYTYHRGYREAARQMAMTNI